MAGIHTVSSSLPSVVADMARRLVVCAIGATLATTCHHTPTELARLFTKPETIPTRFVSTVMLACVLCVTPAVRQSAVRCACSVLCVVPALCCALCLLCVMPAVRRACSVLCVMYVLCVRLLCVRPAVCHACSLLCVMPALCCVCHTCRRQVALHVACGRAPAVSTVMLACVLCVRLLCAMPAVRCACCALCLLCVMLLCAVSAVCHACSVLCVTPAVRHACRRQVALHVARGAAPAVNSVRRAQLRASGSPGVQAIQIYRASGAPGVQAIQLYRASGAPGVQAIQLYSGAPGVQAIQIYSGAPGVQAIQIYSGLMLLSSSRLHQNDVSRAPGAVRHSSTEKGAWWAMRQQAARHF
jgi:hypothetical protein